MLGRVPRTGCSLGVDEWALAVGVMKRMLVKTGSVAIDSAAAEVAHQPDTLHLPTCLGQIFSVSIKRYGYGYAYATKQVRGVGHYGNKLLRHADGCMRTVESSQ